MWNPVEQFSVLENQEDMLRYGIIEIMMFSNVASLNRQRPTRMITQMNNADLHNKCIISLNPVVLPRLTQAIINFT